MSKGGTDIDLSVRKTDGAGVDLSVGNIWHLEIPVGGEGSYRWAQLDDYMHLKRRDFFWEPPVQLSLSARVSANDLCGTWGFGFWNDPFSISAGLGGTTRRLPVLPNAAWFFHASPPNYLSLRDEPPVQGMLASVFSAPVLSSPMLAAGVLLLPLLAFPVTARRLRPISRRFVKDDAARLDIDLTTWHDYKINWCADRVEFFLDRSECFVTQHSPRGPLGLVLWIDNQYAAFTPGGALKFGTLATPSAAWLEMRDVCVQNLEPVG